ncbi:MAG: hypothetical protein HC840_13655, partial [Leptolyngbyaceae cyanobacterium RM2_2_4]|nr:hypothetical protein [Leptolyngbyaceae cyanobacterium RM2_2_4]
MKKSVISVHLPTKWRSLHCNRDGFFEVVELWVENTLMIELLPPAIAHHYLSFMRPENLKQ